jgi:hypothetical protein
MKTFIDIDVFANVFHFSKFSGADEEASDHTIDEDEAHYQAEAEQAKRARAAFLKKPSHAD